MVKALILAGGDGSRLLPLTLHTPKPLLPIGNVPLLLHQIDLLKKAGVSEVILSLSHEPRSIRRMVEDGSRFGIVLRYRTESRPLGTAGALRRVRNLIDDTTIVLNGDVLADFDLRWMLIEHRRRKALVSIGTCKVSNPQAYGTVEVDDAGWVKRLTERPRGPQVRTNRINAGVYIIERQVLEMIPHGPGHYFETDVFPRLLKEPERVQAIDIGPRWYEITRPALYLQSNMDLLEGRFNLPDLPALRPRAKAPTRKGVEIDSRTLIESDAQVKKGARIVQSVIGAGCRIGTSAFIRNSVLWPGCLVGGDAVISGAVLGRGCLIEENAFVRRGAILGDKSVLTASSRS